MHRAAPDFSGITFTMTNASTNPVVVNGREIAVGGTLPITLTTNAAGDAQTAADALPYGDYTIKENATNGKYLLTDGTARSFQIREEGKIVSTSTTGNSLVFEDEVVRGSAAITKTENT